MSSSFSMAWSNATRSRAALVPELLPPGTRPPSWNANTLVSSVAGRLDPRQPGMATPVQFQQLS
jgi:hypothetical protein